MRNDESILENPKAEEKISVTGYTNNKENINSKLFRRCAKQLLNILKRKDFNSSDDLD